MTNDTEAFEMTTAGTRDALGAGESPATHTAPDDRRAAAYAALAIAGCLWGTGFLFGKIALREMSVGDMVLYRFAIACVALIPVAVVSHIPMPRLSDVPAFCVAGALYVPLQFLIQFEGLARTTVSHASLMVGTLPILLALGAVMFGDEHLGRKGWAILTVSTIGTALIVFHPSASGSGRSGATLIGDLLVLVSLLASVGWVLISKRLMHGREGYSPTVASIYILLAGTVMLAAYVFAVGGVPSVSFSTEAWVALIAQGVLATAATTVLWNWGLSHVPAWRAGIFINLEPVVGTILGVSILHESLGPLALVGGVLIVAAAVAFSQHSHT